jgi:hypothetical protein
MVERMSAYRPLERNWVSQRLMMMIVSREHQRYSLSDDAIESINDEARFDEEIVQQLLAQHTRVSISERREIGAMAMSNGASRFEIAGVRTLYSANRLDELRSFRVFPNLNHTSRQGSKTTNDAILSCTFLLSGFSGYGQCRHIIYIEPLIAPQDRANRFTSNFSIIISS